MNQIEQFDRLEKLIIDRSTDISQMRNILHSIREQTEADQVAAQSCPALKRKLVKLQSEISRRDSENARQFDGWMHPVA
jgi:hypothetical protein